MSCCFYTVCLRAWIPVQMHNVYVGVAGCRKCAICVLERPTIGRAGEVSWKVVVMVVGSKMRQQQSVDFERASSRSHYAEDP